MLIVAQAARPSRSRTWASASPARSRAFALMALAYAIIPHEWLTFANSYLKWGDSRSSSSAATRTCSGLPVHWPFNLDYPALRDIVVT